MYISEKNCFATTFNASDVAKSTLAGVTARIIAFGLDMY